jgi:Leucine-rich repeat (LRR) protein
LVSALRIQKNNLIGSVPSEIQSFNQLEIVDFYDNALTGTFPASFSNLTSLALIDVEDNEMTGNPFRTLLELTNLRQLRLSGNSFTGVLNEPAEQEKFGRLSQLREFWIRNNMFRGGIPSTIGNLTSLGT